MRKKQFFKDGLIISNQMQHKQTKNNSVYRNNRHISIDCLNIYT